MCREDGSSSEERMYPSVLASCSCARAAMRSISNAAIGDDGGTMTEIALVRGARRPPRLWRSAWQGRGLRRRRGSQWVDWYRHPRQRRQLEAGMVLGQDGAGGFAARRAAAGADDAHPYPVSESPAGKAQLATAFFHCERGALRG